MSFLERQRRNGHVFQTHVKAHRAVLATEDWFSDGKPYIGKQFTAGPRRGIERSRSSTFCSRSELKLHRDTQLKQAVSRNTNWTDTMLNALQRDVAELLAVHSQRTAELVLACSRGECTACGDVCPVKSRHMAGDRENAIIGLLRSRGPTRVLELIITRERWSQAPGLLSKAKLPTIEKAIRRALAKIEPHVIAVGALDAWYGWREWTVGARLLIVGTERSALYDALPSSILRVNEVTNAKQAVAGLMASMRRAKRVMSFVAQEVDNARRGEYYAWLSSLSSGARLFRYGCDKYFNPLMKQPRVEPPRVRTGHPNPTWLSRYQYGSHPMSCDCNICLNRRY